MNKNKPIALYKRVNQIDPTVEPETGWTCFYWQDDPGRMVSGEEIVQTFTVEEAMHILYGEFCAIANSNAGLFDMPLEPIFAEAMEKWVKTFMKLGSDGLWPAILTCLHETAPQKALRTSFEVHVLDYMPAPKQLALKDLLEQQELEL